MSRAQVFRWLLFIPGAMLGFAALAFLAYSLSLLAGGRVVPSWMEAAGTLATGGAVAFLTLQLVLIESQRDALNEAHFQVTNAVLRCPEGAVSWTLHFEVLNAGLHDSAIGEAMLERQGAEYPQTIGLQKPRRDHERYPGDVLVESGDRVAFYILVNPKHVGDLSRLEDYALAIKPVLGPKAQSLTLRADRRPVSLAEARGLPRLE